MGLAPRVACAEHGVAAAQVPWAEPGSRFTRDFEMECAWPAVFYGDVEVSGGLTLGGQALADALWPVGCVRLTAEDTEPQPSPEGAEWERVDCGMAGIYAWRRIT